MNKLGRDIEKNEKIVMSSRYYNPKYDLTFTCWSGFGMINNAAGTAIYGVFADGERCRVEGYEIDKEKTEELNKKEYKDD